MSLAAKAAAFGSFELTVWAIPWPIGLLLSTYGDAAFPLGMFGDGDALVGAGTPFAIAAAKLSTLARSMLIVFQSAALAMVRDFTSDDFMSRVSWQAGNTGGVPSIPPSSGVQLGSNIGTILLDSSVLSRSRNRNSCRTLPMMTVYRPLAPKEVGEKEWMGLSGRLTHCSRFTCSVQTGKGGG